MTTVAEALVAVAQHLPGTVRGIATGGGEDGGAAYLDDAYGLIRYDDDALIGGALLIETGDMAGAVLTISDSVQATGRVIGAEQIWDRAGSETPAADDVYTVTLGLWTVAQLLRGVAEAVETWGKVEELVTLGTGDGETVAWPLPDGTSGEVVRVYVTSEDGDVRWEWILWETSSTGVVLEGVVENGDAVEALVISSETIGTDTTATISAEIPLDFVGWYGAAAVLRSAIGAPGLDADIYAQLMNYANEQAETVLRRHGGAGVRSRERFMR